MVQKQSPALVIICLSLYLSACQPKQVGWHQIDATPPKIVQGSVAYDTLSKTATLFGGLTDGKFSDETWQWDGSDWASLNPVSHPSAREKHVIVYDEARDKIVLFGGADLQTIYDDTWEWDGNNWHLINPTHRPPARCCHAMAYDATQQRVLLYGGWNGNTNTFFNDTWAWDGTDWIELSCCETPQASGHILVSLSDQHEIINIASVDWTDTWVWNGHDWRNLPTKILPARSTGAAAYDPQNSRVVFFGGIKNQDRLSFDDTWVFDGVNWQILTLDQQPPARWGHMMFYDLNRQSIIMFGGAKDEVIYTDMWEFNLSEDLGSLASTTTP